MTSDEFELRLIGAEAPDGQPACTSRVAGQAN